jgi:Eco57I restriction-modification methylase
MSTGILTPEAKDKLRRTVRELRERLLRDIHDAAEGAYRLSVPASQAGLGEAQRIQRTRLENWLDERARATRPKDKAAHRAACDRFRLSAEKEAAATLLNRLVLIRHLEALGLSRPEVLKGGWNSKGFREYRDFAPGLCDDDTEGYARLLALLFDELAGELPGLFGDVGTTRLFPIPAATLRVAVESLDDPELSSAWTDDTTLGWVYQYWNDPEREALDAKINDGGKIAPHEIASKTQMFTERYMVEWLLQNSLGLTWLCICKRNGWTADAEKVLPVLDARRADWRKRREAGEVALDALMPIEGELEEAWKYYVPQPLPADSTAQSDQPPHPSLLPASGEKEPEARGGIRPPRPAQRGEGGGEAVRPPRPAQRGEGGGEGLPRSIRDVRLLDPACGSGHFLCSAFDLFVLMYREEARHLGRTISDKEIAESILTRNLHGVDIDPRSVQIAAAGLYLKAKTLSREARPSHLNLVAPTLQLGNLPDDDPALVELLSDLKQEAGIPEDLTRRLVASLAGVDHLGTLLKVDAAVNEALSATNLEFERQGKGQGDFFGGFPQQQVKLTVDAAKATVLDKLEQFLSRHSASEDLGLRLDGEQLAAGVRFVRLVREGSYDVVVGNPPYQGLSKTSLSDYVAKHYPRGKADLYAAFLERGLELAREGGISALLTMRGWMFLGQFADLRRHLLRDADVRGLADLGTGAFGSRSMDDVISTVMVVIRREHGDLESYGVQAAPLADPRRDAGKPARRRAALWCHETVFMFDPKGFEVIEGEPIVYWWTKDFLARYADAPKLGVQSPARFGANTGDNVRFLRRAWEVLPTLGSGWGLEAARIAGTWKPFVKGAAGKQWFEPWSDVVRWSHLGFELKTSVEHNYGNIAWKVSNELFYFQRGIAFTMIGTEFAARAHRFASVIGDKGSSVYPSDVAQVLCAMNRTLARATLQSLNPTMSFQVGDVNRLALFPVRESEVIFANLSAAFCTHEATGEPSVEVKRPGPSPWRYAQDWAQRAVDRPESAPLPPYEPEYDPPEPAAFVSFAVGVALGRFGGSGEGILDRAPATALAHGILFLGEEGRDSLEQPACAPLIEAWKEHGAAVGAGDDLRTYLQRSFFDWHKRLYENRPIYFPLSSTKRGYVAFILIHRWQDDTLQVLLADHLLPERRRLGGELDDIRKARTEAKGRGKAERRFAEVSKLLEELSDFIAKVTEVAEHGPPPPDDKTPKREQDARFAMDLDDGVMVNSAALWPLLEPQWKDPKKWWKELATAQGRKDYDWSHLAARYFPSRVREKCVRDPSLAVAHHCFWELHPAKAYAWELRLQDEIRPDFTIDEPKSFEHRAAFLKAHPEEVEAAQTKEAQRRARKAAKDTDDDTDTPLLDRTEEDEPADA